MIVAILDASMAPMFHGARRGFARTVKLGVHGFHNAVDVLCDVVVPESQHTIALGHKPLRSNTIATAARIFAMLRSVNFYDEASGGTGKIDDKISDGHLAAEVSTAHFKSPQMAPEFQFSIGRILA